MEVVVRLPGALQEYASGARKVVVTCGGAGSTTVCDVLDRLAVVHPMLERRIRDEAGGLRRHVNVFVGADNIRDLSALDTEVPPSTEVIVLPAISGG